ncbi:uncharacterized protein B0J16DRAFT_401979 [Fusarium flagelliforme]|uniref:uncharacterized protein n=1 Tax=Fusarium flagelliforme TaxID=2675880 RepID=UPI001E8DA51A|nr:uncharacterized protein B0J16DRAFT_401979 [Fusarium flagelliforme]KAH7183540.1 hypothetical protein B0J16DRAFT_401979 [Fusarium flagelliforme]
MAVKANFLSLPAELRDQIYHLYFRVGGYAYDADSDCLKTAADNRPIDLALLYTCRTIANEAIHLPLLLNSIKFTTLYRRDLNNLAGCFSMVSGLYHHLQADFVLQPAHVLTPEMRAELALEHPNFSSHLDNALLVREHDIEEGQRRYESHREDTAHELWLYGREYNGNSIAMAAKVSLKNQMEDALCVSAEAFLRESTFWEDLMQTSRYWKELSRSFWRVEGLFSHALKLLAQHNPSEFSRQLYMVFPEWDGRHSPQEFFNMRFDHWAIPSPSQVQHATQMLGLDAMWDVPDIWYGPPDDDGTSGIRCRQKIRFSAAANAIRFLETRIPPKHRLNIRTLILHEDLPSVNVPSAHAQGLAPFFRENPLLRVERRVDMMRCMYGAFDNAEDVASHFLDSNAWPSTSGLTGADVGTPILQWLTDALAVTRVGIPAESFTLILEAGPYRDYFTIFSQQRLQKEMAWSRALNYLDERDAFGLEGRALTTIQPDFMRFMMTCEDTDVIESLANETSPILRSDFNAGIALDVGAIVNQTRYLSTEDWFCEWYSDMWPWDLLEEQPPDQVDYKVRLADNYEIQINQ